MLGYFLLTQEYVSRENVRGNRAGCGEVQRTRSGGENERVARRRHSISGVGKVIEFITDAIYC